MFGPTEAQRPLWKVVLWWELRRIPFNIIVGCYGILCLAVFSWGIGNSGQLDPGEDAIEPLAVIAAPFIINFFYTFGWLVEIVVRIQRREFSPRFGPMLFATGLGITLFLMTIPAALWGGIRLLQILGVPM